MRIISAMMVLLVLIAVPACGDDDAGTPGSVGNSCYPNDTCDAGLACISGVCVDLQSTCGDGACDLWESAASCVEDCAVEGCGDGTCASGESYSDCPEDCPEPELCGNDTVAGDEVCDGSTLDGATCATETTLDEGDLLCLGDCLGFDTSGCYTCGDLQLSGPEVCDGTNLGGQDCVGLGLPAGALACAGGCLGLDTSGCVSVCNNDGVCDANETLQNCPADCSGPTCPAGQTCEDVTGASAYACVEGGAIPAGAETGCDVAGCSTSGFTCYCLDASCAGAGAVCLQDC